MEHSKDKGLLSEKRMEVRIVVSKDRFLLDSMNTTLAINARIGFFHKIHSPISEYVSSGVWVRAYRTLKYGISDGIVKSIIPHIKQSIREGG